MLLRDRLVQSGHIFFKYRGWQPLPMLVILLVERDHFSRIADNLGYELICIAISLLGLVIRALTVSFVHDGTSGRNTKKQRATELNTTGAYSIVRNPLYVANYLVLLGTSMLTQNVSIVMLNTILFVAVYLPIILTEEAFLLDQFGETYRAYAARVNCVIPSFKNYERNRRTFSLAMLLKREHDTLFTTILGLFLIELFREYGQWGTVRLEPVWIVVASTAAATWITLKMLKKTGRLVVPQERAC